MVSAKLVRSGAASIEARFAELSRKERPLTPQSPASRHALRKIRLTVGD